MTMSTTQQHWMSNTNELYLVYTRKTDENGDVPCWRAPLFTARFDVKRECLLKQTEQELFPLIRKDSMSNTLGNFYVVDISPASSIVSVGSRYCKAQNGKYINT